MAGAMGPSRNTSAAPALLACALLVAACAGQQPEGEEKKRTVILSTEYHDQRAGEETSEKIEAEMGIVQDPALTAYVQEIGKRLVRYAPPRTFEYRFAIVDQPVPNAFALPGGYIYLSRGAVALANTEDELANVIGHEIHHSAARHAAAQQETARRSSVFLMPFLRFARLAAYGRDQERDADMGGQILAAKAGYDPMGMADFLQHLGNTERLAIGYSRLPGYFDTHPSTTERVATTVGRARDMEWERDPSRETGPAAYLRNIEGVVLGPNPAEGIFRKNHFLHPDLDFQLSLPEGWQLLNTHQAVGAISPGGEARVFLMLDSDEPDAKKAAEAFFEKHAQEFRARLERGQPVKIGELDAYRIEIRARVGGLATTAHITFIPYNGTTYRITGATPAAAAAEYVGRTRNVARSFRPLSEADRTSFEILRLRVVEAEAGEDLAALSARTGNSWDEGRTAVLNGLFHDARFEEGQLVKIARAEPYLPGGSSD